VLGVDNEKKRSEETQTLLAGCSNAEPKIFDPSQTPFPGVRDGQNLISWRHHYLHLQTQFGEDRCMQFRVIVVTDPPPTHKHTHRQDRLQYTAPQLGRNVMKNNKEKIEARLVHNIVDKIGLTAR